MNESNLFSECLAYDPDKAHYKYRSYKMVHNDCTCPVCGEKWPQEKQPNAKIMKMDEPLLLLCGHCFSFVYYCFIIDNRKIKLLEQIITRNVYYDSSKTDKQS